MHSEATFYTLPLRSTISAYPIHFAVHEYLSGCGEHLATIGGNTRAGPPRIETRTSTTNSLMSRKALRTTLTSRASYRYTVGGGEFLVSGILRHTFLILRSDKPFGDSSSLLLARLMHGHVYFMNRSCLQQLGLEQCVHARSQSGGKRQTECDGPTSIEQFVFASLKIFLMVLLRWKIQKFDLERSHHPPQHRRISKSISLAII